MGAGLGLLQLPPAHFWSMTPKELTAALEGKFGIRANAPPDRAELSALMARFPDG